MNEIKTTSTRNEIWVLNTSLLCTYQYLLAQRFYVKFGLWHEPSVCRLSVVRDVRTPCTEGWTLGALFLHNNCSGTWAVCIKILSKNSKGFYKEIVQMKYKEYETMAFLCQSRVQPRFYSWGGVRAPKARAEAPRWWGVGRGCPLPTWKGSGRGPCPSPEIFLIFLNLKMVSFGAFWVALIHRIQLLAWRWTLLKLVTQGHWNRCHSKAWVRFPIRLL